MENLPVTELEHRLLYAITQCYLQLDTGDRARINFSQTDRFLVYLIHDSGRLS